MAFKQNKSLPSGIVLTEAYFKIAKVDLDVINKRLEVTINIYKDQECRNNDMLPVESSLFAAYEQDFEELFNIAEIDKQDVNVIKQAYKFLRKQSDFAEAIDVL